MDSVDAGPVVVGLVGAVGRLAEVEVMNAAYTPEF